MRKIGNHVIGIDQGEEVLFSDFEHDGEMWTGEGPRKTDRHVKFDGQFEVAPAVNVALAMWDMSNAANMRVDVRAENVDTRGFDIVFRTWGDSKVARVRVSWQAIGPVSDEEAWDI